MGKVLSLAALSRVLARDRRARRKVVFTNGCFDILHVGHVRYLANARSLGDRLVVAVNADASVRRLKGPDRPVNSQKDRAEVLASLASVDYVAVFMEDTPEKTIKVLRPDWLVKGGDWKKKDIVGSDFVESYGGKVRSLPFVEGRSTTGIFEKVRRG